MFAGEAARERLYEVCVDCPAMGTGEDAAVVRVEVQSLMRVDQGLLTTVTLERKRNDSMRFRETFLSKDQRIRKL